MGGGMPIDFLRADYESLVPPQERVADWEERWEAVSAYVDSFTIGKPSGFVITPEQRIALATADYEHHVQEVSERLGFQQELSVAGLKGLMFINGGAIVGLLTFIGNASPQFDQLTLGRGIIAFVVGLIANMVAYLAGYYSQAHFMNLAVVQSRDDQRSILGLEPSGAAEAFLKTGNGVLMLAVISSVLSLVSFCVGVWFVADAFYSTK